MSTQVKFSVRVATRETLDGVAHDLGELRERGIGAHELGDFGRVMDGIAEGRYLVIPALPCIVATCDTCSKISVVMNDGEQQLDDSIPCSHCDDGHLFINVATDRESVSIDDYPTTSSSDGTEAESRLNNYYSRFSAWLNGE